MFAECSLRCKKQFLQSGGGGGCRNTLAPSRKPARSAASSDIRAYFMSSNLNHLNIRGIVAFNMRNCPYLYFTEHLSRPSFYFIFYYYYYYYSDQLSFSREVELSAGHITFVLSKNDPVTCLLLQPLSLYRTPIKN